MEPTFKYLKNPENGTSESVNIETKHVNEQNKDAEIVRKKTSTRHGSSLGWGWFQGFNLFITGCFLILCFVFAYFMMGGESTRQGPPKYTIDRANDLGKAIFNPVLSEEERESFVYKPPIKRPSPKNEDKPVLDELELINQASTQESLPALTLISSAETEEDEGISTDESTETFYGDSPFGLHMESLQLESSSSPEVMPPSSTDPYVQELMQQAIIAWNKGQLSEPYQNSALSFYHRILESDPNNVDALSGIDRLANHYLNQAKREMNRGDYFSALDYADLGLKADPLNPELNTIKAQLINE